MTRPPPKDPRARGRALVDAAREELSPSTADRDRVWQGVLATIPAASASSAHAEAAPDAPSAPPPEAVAPDPTLPVATLGASTAPLKLILGVVVATTAGLVGVGIGSSEDGPTASEHPPRELAARAPRRASPPPDPMGSVVGKAGGTTPPPARGATPGHRDPGSPTEPRGAPRQPPPGSRRDAAHPGGRAPSPTPPEPVPSSSRTAGTVSAVGPARRCTTSPAERNAVSAARAAIDADAFDRALSLTEGPVGLDCHREERMALRAMAACRASGDRSPLTAFLAEFPRSMHRRRVTAYCGD